MSVLFLANCASVPVWHGVPSENEAIEKVFADTSDCLWNNFEIGRMTQPEIFIDDHLYLFGRGIAMGYTHGDVIHVSEEFALHGTLRHEFIHWITQTSRHDSKYFKTCDK